MSDLIYPTTPSRSSSASSSLPSPVLGPLHEDVHLTLTSLSQVSLFDEPHNDSTASICTANTSALSPSSSAPSTSAAGSTLEQRGEHELSKYVESEDLFSGTSTTVVPSARTRKAYTVSRPRELWTSAEHHKFVDALAMYERDWKKIAAYVGTKSLLQIRSHAQKYFVKMQKMGLDYYIPPPRPKRRSRMPEQPQTQQTSTPVLLLQPAGMPITTMINKNADNHLLYASSGANEDELNAPLTLTASTSSFSLSTSAENYTSSTQPPLRLHSLTAAANLASVGSPSTAASSSTDDKKEKHKKRRRSNAEDPGAFARSLLPNWTIPGGMMHPHMIMMACNPVVMPPNIMGYMQITPVPSSSAHGQAGSGPTNGATLMMPYYASYPSPYYTSYSPSVVSPSPFSSPMLSSSSCSASTSSHNYTMAPSFAQQHWPYSYSVHHTIFNGNPSVPTTFYGHQDSLSSINGSPTTMVASSTSIQNDTFSQFYPVHTYQCTTSSSTTWASNATSVTSSTPFSVPLQPVEEIVPHSMSSMICTSSFSSSLSPVPSSSSLTTSSSSSFSPLPGSSDSSSSSYITPIAATTLTSCSTPSRRSTLVCGYVSSSSSATSIKSLSLPVMRLTQQFTQFSPDLLRSNNESVTSEFALQPSFFSNSLSEHEAENTMHPQEAKKRATESESSLDPNSIHDSYALLETSLTLAALSNAKQVSDEELAEDLDGRLVDVPVRGVKSVEHTEKINLPVYSANKESVEQAHWHQTGGVKLLSSFIPPEQNAASA